MGAIPRKHNPGLQAQNTGGIAAFERQTGNLLGAERMSQRSVLRVHERGNTAHFYDNYPCGYLHGNV